MEVSLSYHFMLVCFKPSKDLWSLWSSQTILDLETPGGMVMHTFVVPYVQIFLYNEKGIRILVK